jgi:hypothetical protein
MWAESEFEEPTNGELYLGADYQQYMTSEEPGISLPSTS